MIAHRGHLARHRQVVTILARHGFGFLVDHLGLSRPVPFQWGILGHARRGVPCTQPEHLRPAFEEPGGNFSMNICIPEAAHYLGDLNKMVN